MKKQGTQPRTKKKMQKKNANLILRPLYSTFKYL
jgi:hypothetical protein